MKEIELFVPGRLCLFGEHSDWAGAYRAIDPSISVGHCIAVGTNQGIAAIVQPHSDKLMITSKLASGKVLGPEVMDMDESNLYRVAKAGDFFSYCAGVAYYFRTRYKVGGLSIRTSMDLPIKRGLSSSAQFIAKGEREREEAIEILRELDVECFKLDIKNSNG